MFINGNQTIQGTVNFCGNDTGSGNAYAAASTGTALKAYVAGLDVSFRAMHSNTGPSTFNADGIGTAWILKHGGTADLESGDIPAGAIVRVQHDGMFWQLINGSSSLPPTVAVWRKYLVTLESTGESPRNILVNGESAGVLSSTVSGQKIPLFTVEARTVFHSVVMKASVAFAAKGATAITVTAGLPYAPDALMMTPYDLMQPVTSMTYYAASGIHAISFGPAVAILTLNVPGSTPSELSAGALEVNIRSSVLA